MCTCALKVPLVKKWVNYMPRKGVKLEKEFFFSFFFWFNSRISLTAVLTNMKLGGEMKLCDLMNNIMFESMFFLTNLEQYIIKGTCI